MNRAVAAFSSKSKASPPSARTAQAPALLVDRRDDSRFVVAAEVEDAGPASRPGAAASWVSARLDASPDTPAGPSGSLPSNDAPHQDRRDHRAGIPRSRDSRPPGRGRDGRRPPELLPWDARGARPDGPLACATRPGRAGRPVAILQDLPGPKLRIGPLRDDVVELTAGEQLTFICGDQEIAGDAHRMSDLLGRAGRRRRARIDPLPGRRLGAPAGDGRPRAPRARSTRRSRSAARSPRARA